MSNKKIIEKLKNFKIAYKKVNGELPQPHIIEAYITSLELNN